MLDVRALDSQLVTGRVITRDIYIFFFIRSPFFFLLKEHLPDFNYRDTINRLYSTSILNAYVDMCFRYIRTLEFFLLNCTVK